MGESSASSSPLLVGDQSRKSRITNSMRRTAIAIVLVMYIMCNQVFISVQVLTDSVSTSASSLETSDYVIASMKSDSGTLREGVERGLRVTIKRMEKEKIAFSEEVEKLRNEKDVIRKELEAAKAGSTVEPSAVKASPKKVAKKAAKKTSPEAAKAGSTVEPSAVKASPKKVAKKAAKKTSPAPVPDPVAATPLPAPIVKTSPAKEAMENTSPAQMPKPVVASSVATTTATATKTKAVQLFGETESKRLLADAGLPTNYTAPVDAADMMRHMNQLSQESLAVDDVELARKFPVPDVVEMSRGLPAVDPSSNITTALCCKAMFGNVDLSRVALWVAYNRLLGFDHVFLYYHDVIADFPDFDKLNSLPYLTMTPIKGKMVKISKKSQKSTNGTSIPYYRFMGESNQKNLEVMCFNKHAKDYDWVMIADIDEYLAFNEEMGVKDFIAKYTETSTNSLGIGKKVYTLTARADKVDSGFGLDSYAFTPGIHCLINRAKFHREKLYYKRTECSGAFGSTKLIVRPQYHRKGVNVHGPNKPSKKAGQIQINTDIARFMEYQFMHQRINATYHNKVDFLVTSGVDLRLVTFDEAYTPNENGTWTIRYDDKPSRWYQYVASRGLDSSPKSLL